MFGMGTGVSLPLLPPETCQSESRRATARLENSIASTNNFVDPSPRPISTGRLNTLPCLHLRPINLVVYQGPYPVNPVGDLISE